MPRRFKPDVSALASENCRLFGWRLCADREKCWAGKFEPKASSLGSTLHADSSAMALGMSIAFRSYTTHKEVIYAQPERTMSMRLGQTLQRLLRKQGPRRSLGPSLFRQGRLQFQLGLLSSTMPVLPFLNYDRGLEGIGHWHAAIRRAGRTIYNSFSDRYHC